MVTPTRPGRRANGEGLIRQRRDGRWEGRDLLPTGKPKAVYGKTQKDVRQKLQELRQQVREGRVAGTERQTVAQFLERWLEDVVRVKNAPKTRRDYEMIVRVHLVPALGRHPLHGLTAQHIQTWLNELGAHHAPRTVHYYRATLRAALNQAVKWRLIPYNPAAATEGPKQARKRIEAMSGERAREILAAFEGHQLEGLVTVLLATGMRPGEALGLCWADVDLDAGLLKVQTARSGQLKRESSWRMLVLPDVARRVLADRPRTDALVFPASAGGHQDGTTVLHQFQRRLKEAGLPKMTLYELRHGHATLQLTQGAGLREIMEQLGHTQISTTANIYTHIAPELRRKAAERIDRVFGQ